MTPQVKVIITEFNTQNPHGRWRNYHNLSTDLYRHTHTHTLYNTTGGDKQEKTYMDIKNLILDIIEFI